MTSAITKSARFIFEICNEMYTAIASGPLGIILVTYTGLVRHCFVKTVFITSLTVGSIIYLFKDRALATPSIERIVFITGCDSGLGFSFAQHISDLGFTVVAGFLNLNSKGAQILKNKKRLIQVQIDITDEVNVERIVQTITMYLHDENRELWAVINNAGVMVFGEFEWLTEELIQEQVKVNLFGTLRVARLFCPLLRKYKGRLITISSHCATQALPGLSVYAATKAALLAWSDGVRVEMKKYGVKVITFVPSNFVLTSNIMARQNEHAYKMSAAFSTEQKLFYGDYFKRYNMYLSKIAHENEPVKISDKKLYEKFELALLEVDPRTKYVYETMKYTFYHTLFKYSPVFIRDYLVVKFMTMPEYRPPEFIPDTEA